MSRAKSTDAETVEIVAGSDPGAGETADSAGAAGVEGEASAETAAAAADPAPTASDSTDAPASGAPVMSESDPVRLPPPFDPSGFEAFKDRVAKDEQYAMALLWRFEQLAILMGWPELGHMVPLDPAPMPN